MSTSTASVLTRQLEHYGVSVVFGIPGVHTLELYRGLATTSIQHVTPRHEQGAGFMAEGYARVSGKPGVCFVISGPGMTNILTAMGQAYSESVPMLVISSVNSHGRMGSGDGWLHELSDQQAMARGVCAFSHTLHHPDELMQVLARAFAVFDSQRPRPVHIEIPVNLLGADCRFSPVNTTNVMRLTRSRACANGIRQAACELGNARHPLLLVGGGAVQASAGIVELAERLDAPVVMTVNARGIVPCQHPLAVPASASLPAVRHLIASADVVLGIGTEMGPTDYDVNDDGLFMLNACFIRIDIDAQQLVRNQLPQLALTGDAQTSIHDLLQALDTDPGEFRSTRDHANNTQTTGASRAATAREESLAALSLRDKRYLSTLECLRDTLPQLVIVGDSTQIVYAGNSLFGTNQPISYFNSAMGFGTLGYALPAAIGAALANPQRPIVAISGDGGLQFCLAELVTAVDEELNVILIVHENGGYQEIDKSMQSHSIKPIGVNLRGPDLQGIAMACGWKYSEPDALDHLSDHVTTASEEHAPTLIVLRDVLFEENTNLSR